MEYDDFLKAWAREFDSFYVIEKETGARSGCFDAQIIIDVYSCETTRRTKREISEYYPYIRLEDSMTSPPSNPRSD